MLLVGKDIPMEKSELQNTVKTRDVHQNNQLSFLNAVQN